jgi:hypothetical protein
MSITLHIGNKECGTCIPKDINIAYKLDENDLNVHIQLYLGYGVKKQNVHELGHGTFLNAFLCNFLQSALSLPQLAFWLLYK